MLIQISGHHLEITAALDEFIRKKLLTIEKHFVPVLSIHVILNINKSQQEAEATLHIPKAEIFAKASSPDMYKTIEILVEKIIRQLEKHKGKTHG